MAVHDSAPGAVDLKIQGLNHFTLPVRDRYAAARFYTAVLGAEVDHESAPDRVARGQAHSLQVGVRICDGAQIDLFEQPFGQPSLDQSHPHHAFEIAAEDVTAWVERLRYWGVTFVGPITRAGGTAAEIYFRDPDGNNLELHCTRYPDEQRATLATGPFRREDLEPASAWPPAERAVEADRLLEEKLERMRARRGRA